MRHLLLPPIVWLSSIAAMFYLHERHPLVHADPTHWRTAVGLLLAVAAVAVTAWHKRLFQRAGTNVNTFGRPDRLVEAGLFRHIRNPMYLGFLASLAGFALVMGALSPWIVVAAFFLITDLWYIPFEERLMGEKFGAEYQTYRSRTRRWI